jgi:hypothetical protein
LRRIVDTELQERIIRRFGNNNVIPEWDVARDSHDALDRHIYCPRIDFAVGPFNTNAELRENNQLITEEYEKHLPFFNQLKNANQEEWRPLAPNRNPRCFIAIEVEKSGSRKHRIGSIINASAIGKVGILVAVDEGNYRALNRIRRYLDFINRAEKSDFYPQNVLIVRRDDFMNLV